MRYQPLNGDLYSIAGKRVCAYFKKAGDHTDRDVNVHREFVRDVIDIFAHKTELTFAQACQISKGHSFLYARAMHERLADKVGRHIFVMGEKQDNPRYKRLRDLSEMAPHDHVSFMRDGWAWATSLRHPLDRPPTRGDSEMSRNRETAIAKNILKHQDETLEAHRRRALEALRLYMDGDLLGAVLVYNNIGIGNSVLR